MNLLLDTSMRGCLVGSVAHRCLDNDRMTKRTKLEASPTCVMVGAVGWDTGEEEQRRALTKCGLQGRNKGSFFLFYFVSEE